MTSSEPIDGSKTSNEDKEEENEPKRSFRAEYARKSHNNIEKKRKDKIAFWINKIYELLPKDPKKESKNGILEKAYHYMVHLKEMNDKLIYGNADQITGEELRFARKKITKLEETNAVYYKILKMSGITPNNIPLDVMKPLTPKNSKLKQEKVNLDKVNPSTNSGDDNSDAASDTTELIRDEDTTDQFNKSGDQNSTQSTPVPERININSLFQKTPLLVVNQNQDQNAPRISLSNGSQLKIRPSPNVQILGNGALAIDSSGFNQGPIILGSTLLSPPQPTTLFMSNGQLLSLVNQPQPAFVYTPGAGFVLTSSTPINNSINVPVKSTEQAEKGKKKMRANNEPEVNSIIVSPETKETQTRPKRSRTYQKAQSKQVPIIEMSLENDQSIDDQQNLTSTPVVRSTKRLKGGRASRKAKETSDKLTISEVNLQNDSASVIKEKRPRPTTVIERVADSPVKSCTIDKQASKNVNSSKGSTKEFDETLTSDNTSKKLIPCDDLTSNDLETENRIDYTFRQNADNNEAACDQDQLPLLLGSLSDDHEMSTESVHSVSNSSLPTFLSLSPSDHLTDFLSKTADHNNTTRSPRYSSPINRLNTSAPTAQTPSVIMSNQSTNIISEPSNCHPPHHLLSQNDKDPMFEGNLEASNKNMEPEMRGKDNNVSMCVDENYSNSINQHHHHHHHLMINERESIESSAHGSNDGGADSGQTRLYATDSQENRRSETNKSTSSLTEIGLRKSSESRDPSTSSSTAPTATTTTSLSSNVNASSSSGNNSGTSQERNFLPYSAESLLRQQPQQQSTTMPTSGPINSIYHVHSNVDPNIDFSNRGTASAPSNNVSSNSRPTISYSAERLIHSPPIDTTVSANQSSRHKSHEANKVSSIPNNQSNNSANIYNEQYSIRTARGSTDMDSNLSRIQSNHHQHHAQQQQHVSNVYRTSPQTQDQRANQDQHQSSRSSNPSSQSQQQIMHQQRDVYPENHLHHHQQPPQSSRSQTQANSTSQVQINMKTTGTSDSSTTNGSNSNSNVTTNNNSTNNGREIFNHPYPYGPMPNDGSSSGDRNTNHSSFANNGNHQNDSFIESNSQNNFIPPFAPPNNNCQPSFNSTNNRRSGSSSTAMLAPFPFSDPLNSSSSFSSDPYSRPAHTSSANATSVANFDTNRRIGNSGHFVDHTSSSAANNANNNYFMMHNHHVASSALPNSNNPPIFSTSSSFPSLISSSTNSNYDNNGYNLTCPPRPSSNVNTTVNISGSTSTISNSNLHSHHHSHHSVFYGDSSIPPMHNSRRQSELSPYSASSKSVNNGGSSGSSKTNNNGTASTPPTNSKQSGKSVGGSSKSTKKGSAANVAKSRGQSSNNDARLSINNPPVVNSYSSMPSFVPPPSSSTMVNHRSVVTPSSSSTASVLNVSSSERSIDGGESLFRPQPQSNSANNMQTASSRSSGPSSHSLPPVGHSSTFLPNFSFNIFPEIGSINPNENFAMTGLSAIKFNHANHVLPHHPNPNAPFTHSSALQAPGSMDNSASSMGDNSSHQNIYGHHSRISTPHHHNHVSFIPLIGTSPRTLK